MSPWVSPLLLWLLGVAVQPAMVMFHYPRWSPDGRWLVLTTNVEGGDDEEVWVVSADGATKRRLTTNDVPDTGADWLADGRTIVFERQTPSGTERLAMDADGRNVRPDAVDQARLASRRRSHDGATLEERRNDAGQIVIFRSTQGEQRIGAARWSEQPSFSPDGRFVVIEQRDDPHEILKSEIAVWDASTRQLRVVGRGTDPSWSPDGRTLLFKRPSTPGDELHITTLDRASGTSRTLARGVHPQFSPDGSWIVYMSDDPARADVYVMRADGGDRRCVTCSWK
jgi:Tol biopolymer transport system component